MNLKCIEGSAALTEDTVVLTFDSTVAVAAKKALGRRIIPLKHVREVDFVAPTVWKPGHLRIIMGADQERVHSMNDTFAVVLGAGRRLKEAQEFAARLQQAVEAVEYEAPEPPTTEAESMEPPAAGAGAPKPKASFKDFMNGLAEASAALDEAVKSSGSFRGITLSGRTLRKGTKSWPVGECEIVIDAGANVGSRVTATRVATGALLAGPAGALIGSIAKKDRSAVYMTVITPDDMFFEQVSGLDEAKAREFATKVKRASMLDVKEKAGAGKDDAARAAAAVPPPPPAGVPAGWYPRGDVQEYWDGTAWTGNTAPLAQG